METRVPAKINLWLEVVRKRSDGYHELSSLMLPIRVYDRVKLLFSAGEGIRVECDCPGVPNDKHNLAWKAAKLYTEQAGLDTGLLVRIEKDIPVGAGLGGGSADAAAVLLGLNGFFHEQLDAPSLHGIARRLGADVAFFLYQQPSLATGIGERLQRIDGIPSYPLVLIKPPLMVSTRWVYQSLKLTRGENRINVNGFKDRPWQLREVMENDLESITISEYPLLAQVKSWLLARGALGALMSGSGPTIFGVFPEMRQAELIAAAARKDWVDCWVAAVESIGSPGDS